MLSSIIYFLFVYSFSHKGTLLCGVGKDSHGKNVSRTLLDCFIFVSYSKVVFNKTTLVQTNSGLISRTQMHIK